MAKTLHPQTVALNRRSFLRAAAAFSAVGVSILKSAGVAEEFDNASTAIGNAFFGV